IGIEPPTITVTRSAVAIGCRIENEGRASGMFDPVRRQHWHTLDDSVAQQEDAEAAEIPQRYTGAAAADLLPGFRFQRVERVELHPEAGPDPLRHVVGQRFPRGRRYQAAEHVSIAGIVIELAAG